MSEICCKLHALANGLPVHKFPMDFSRIPTNGVYLLFEHGENGHGGNRIVRVGTHTGDKQLRARIQQHFLQENKDRSIFRKNIGRALLQKENDPFLAQWDADRTTRKSREMCSAWIDLEKQRNVEVQVTNYLRKNFSFVVFEIHQKDARLYFESKMISTVSLCEECGPSQHWLGNFSPKEKIRQSGLWLVNELYKQALFTEDFAWLEKIAQSP